MKTNIRAIWSNAPAGATHWTPRNFLLKEGFWKIEEGGAFFFDGKWMPSGADPLQNDMLIRLTDLPGIGDTVRVVENGECGIVVAHVEECAVVRMSYGLGCFVASDLEVVPTAEQIAAQARAIGIAEIISAANGQCGRHAAELIYDAGYRKPG